MSWGARRPQRVVICRGFPIELVASISSGSSRGQRAVTWRATPVGVPSRPMHRGVAGRQNSGALWPFASMVTGGCDDSSGDTRRGRGLPFDSMSVMRPPPSMPTALCAGEAQRWRVQPVVQVGAKPGSRVMPGRHAQRSESSAIAMPPGLMWGPPPPGWRCPRNAMSSRCSVVGPVPPISLLWLHGCGSARLRPWEWSRPGGRLDCAVRSARHNHVAATSWVAHGFPRALASASTRSLMGVPPPRAGARPSACREEHWPGHAGYPRW
jgi:hypothetical protein